MRNIEIKKDEIHIDKIRKDKITLCENIILFPWEIALKVHLSPTRPVPKFTKSKSSQRFFSILFMCKSHTPDLNTLKKVNFENFYSWKLIQKFWPQKKFLHIDNLSFKHKISNFLCVFHGLNAMKWFLHIKKIIKSFPHFF